MLDLSMLTEPGVKFCVRCYNKESVAVFLEEMTRQYPEKTKYWEEGEGERKWDSDVGYFDYFPYLNNHDGTSLLWNNEHYAEDNGYTIVNFNDLPGANGGLFDFGEIVAPDFDLSVLF